MSESEYEHYDYVIKCIFIGDSGTGKSSILMRYIKKTFDITQYSTIGVDFYSHLMNIGKKTYKLQFWDLGGQMSFRNIVKSYYRNAAIVFFVFDLSHRESFLSLEEWLESMNINLNNSLLVLIGNKSDLLSNRTISSHEIYEMQQKFNCEYYEVSAKENINIDDLFTNTLNKLIDKHTFEKLDNIIISENPIKKTRCCYLV
jgi:small GTP-binding protein